MKIKFLSLVPRKSRKSRYQTYRKQRKEIVSPQLNQILITKFLLDGKKVDLKRQNSKGEIESLRPETRQVRMMVNMNASENNFDGFDFDQIIPCPITRAQAETNPLLRQPKRGKPGEDYNLIHRGSRDKEAPARWMLWMHEKLVEMGQAEACHIDDAADGEAVTVEATTGEQAEAASSDAEGHVPQCRLVQVRTQHRGACHCSAGAGRVPAASVE